MSMVKGEKDIRYCYAVGLTTWPKPFESIERKVGAYGDEVLVSWRCMSTLRFNWL